MPPVTIHISSSDSDYPPLPSLYTIDHPGVRRISPTEFIFFDPNEGISRFADNEVTPAGLLVDYCAFDQQIRQLTDLTRRIPRVPVGYSRIAALFNRFATGQRRFALWDITNNFSCAETSLPSHLLSRQSLSSHGATFWDKQMQIVSTRLLPEHFGRRFSHLK
ncbi:hypothetical protein CPC08DRAFT_768014 [Agrocybe pediades]|nr:hypothetical protein CPC08DRAFT_768014 [Agrocybe pediades]